MTIYGYRCAGAQATARPAPPPAGCTCQRWPGCSAKPSYANGLDTYPKDSKVRTPYLPAFALPSPSFSSGSGGTSGGSGGIPTALVSYTNEGCYVTAAPDVALDLSYSSNITTDFCANLARAAGKSYFALNDGGQCWGVNDLARAKSGGASTNCNKPCTGNTITDGSDPLYTDATCGGWFADQLYAITPTYTSKGCYAGGWLGVVAAPLDTSYSATVTKSLCSDYARDNGYSVFVLNDGGQCW